MEVWHKGLGETLQVRNVRETTKVGINMAHHGKVLAFGSLPESMASQMG